MLVNTVVMKGGFFYNNRLFLKTAIRIIFGIVWLIDGAFKFLFDSPATFTQMVQAAGVSQPAFLMPWFNFWAGVVGQTPQFWFYLIAISETLLGLALIFGFVRKIAYSLGLFLSLIIWAVPEGFGGAYGPSSTDIGTGIIYAIVFLALILINTEFGISRYSLDEWLEGKIGWWYKLAEFGDYSARSAKKRR